jgi:hypothetical protein
VSRHGVAALLLAIAVAPAWAQEGDGGGGEERSYRLFGTWNVTWEDNQTAEDEPGGEAYQKLKSLLNLNLVWWRLSAGVQLEYLDFSDPELVDPGDLDRLREGFELRKYWIEYLSDPFDARLGTFFTSFGHGMTLYVQKNDVVGFDEPIHGGSAALAARRFELTALGGEVTEPLLSNRFGREFEDVIWGTSARSSCRRPHLGGSLSAPSCRASTRARTTTRSTSGGGGGGSSCRGARRPRRVVEIEQTERGSHRERPRRLPGPVVDHRAGDRARRVQGLLELRVPLQQPADRGVDARAVRPRRRQRTAADGDRRRREDRHPALRQLRRLQHPPRRGLARRH